MMKYYEETRKCVICHTHFTPNAPRQCTCGGDCKEINERQRKAARSKECYLKYHKFADLKCNICGKPIQRRDRDCSKHYHLSCCLAEARHELEIGILVSDSPAVKRCLNVFGIKTKDIMSYI